MTCPSVIGDLCRIIGEFFAEHTVQTEIWTSYERKKIPFGQFS
jgi:hypothetical protein